MGFGGGAMTTMARTQVKHYVLWIFLQTLSQRRRAILYWAGALAALTFYVGAFYPSIQGNEVLNELFKDLPAYLVALFGEVVGIATAEGFLDSKVFLLTAPAYMAIFTIGFGISIIAGEEHARTIDLLLANPISRTRVVLEKYAAMALATLVLVVAQGLGMWLASAAFRFPLSAGAALISYFINSFAALSETSRRLRPLSLFYYYHGHEPFFKGVHWGDLGVLAGFTLFCLALSLVAVNRRDLGT